MNIMKKGPSMEIVPLLGELGFMGSSLPETSGGSGVSNVAYGLILHELERGRYWTKIFRKCTRLISNDIHAYGSKEQKERWLEV